MNKIEYEELIAFHPGYYVKDYIEDQGITQEELAKRLQTKLQQPFRLVLLGRNQAHNILVQALLDNLGLDVGGKTELVFPFCNLPYKSIIVVHKK